MVKMDVGYKYLVQPLAPTTTRWLRGAAGSSLLLVRTAFVWIVLGFGVAEVVRAINS